MTEKRKAVLDIVCGSRIHPTAEQVFAQLKHSHPGAALATVYNNLNILSESGLIRRIEGKDSIVHYDGNSLPHGHLLCVRCGVLKDFWVDEVFGKLYQQIDFPILSCELNIRYVCDNCNKNLKENNL